MAPAPKFSPREQEQIILDAAVSCIEETSLLDFTMSSVSKKAGLSMGSIYKHVQCKEDIIFALATRACRNQASVFKQIMSMPLTTPEKVMGIMLLDPVKNALYSFDSHLEAFSANEVVINSASERWTEQMIKAGEVCEEIFFNCMVDAAKSGELSLQGMEMETLIEEINLGCWALCVGHQHVLRVTQIRSISDGTVSLNEAVATDSHIARSLQRLLNAYHWQTPLDKAGIEKVAALLTEQGLR